MTQQQIETMDGILNGDEFLWKPMTTPHRFNGAGKIEFRNEEGDWENSRSQAGLFLKELTLGKITLVPQPPEPLSDEMGEALWLAVICRPVDGGMRQILIEEGLLQGGGASAKGKYLLGQWLMEKNKEVV